MLLIIDEEKLDKSSDESRLIQEEKDSLIKDDSQSNIIYLKLFKIEQRDMLESMHDLETQIRSKVLNYLRKVYEKITVECDILRALPESTFICSNDDELIKGKNDF